MAAARPAPYYGATTVTNASVEQFVEGFEARNAATTRAGLKAAAAGILATAAIAYVAKNKKAK